MKKLRIVVALSLMSYLVAQSEGIWNKLYVLRGNIGSDEIIFIYDKETKTRCYAVSNHEVNVSGYAISCVPK